MSLSLERVHSNLIYLINNLLYNPVLDNEREKQIISQLIYYDNENPLSQLVLTQDECKNLFLDRVFPYSFESYSSKAITELRVFFPELDFKNGQIVEDYLIVFDIIVHKSLYMIRSENDKVEFRPYRIAQEIMKMLNDKEFYKINPHPIGSGINFKRVMPLKIDDNFQCLRLIGSYKDFVKS